MLTLVELENGGCSRCHNRMLDELAKMERVASVHSDFSKGCLVVEHEGDPSALVASIVQADRGVAVAANGERVMVRVVAHELSECPYRMPPRARGGVD